MARNLSHPADAEPFRLANSASQLLLRAERLASDRFTQLVGENVTLRQFAVLAAIAESPGASQKEIGDTSGVDRSTLAEMLGRMERRGWIARKASKADARARAVNLTDAGEEMLESVSRHARAADAAILDALPSAKRKSFVNTLRKLAKFYEEAAAKAERDAQRKAEKAERKKQREARKKEKAKAEAKGKRTRKKPPKKSGP